MSAPRGAASLSAVKLALAARQAREGLADPGLPAAEPVAIVGVGCRLPGAPTPEAFWQMLASGVDAVGSAPPERWNADAIFDVDPAAPGATATRWGGFLDDVDRFDAAFFGISPREAASMDPQHRLFLEVAWEALEDAGQTRESLAGRRVDVCLGLYNGDYAQRLYADHRAIDAYTIVGATHSIAAGRLSYLLDLRGASLVVDTACSSSLVAVHLACRSLRDHRSELAVAGGVSLVLAPDRDISLSKWGFMAPDGRCKPFDRRANGWVRGEGCGIVVLKRLSDALADRDPIYAVVRGTAVNEDGRSSVLTAPNGSAQRAVIEDALKDARVAASEIGYVEAHGTGTVLGDPIELDAMADVIGRTPGPPCLVGGVKANIGHLEAAAGVAGLIKVALMLRHGRIPPHVHFTGLSDYVSLEGTRIEISAEGRPWPGGPDRRLAGVSAFGFSGTNAHVIVEEAPKRPAEAPAAADHPVLLTLSARSEAALSARARQFAEMLERDDISAETFHAIAATAARRRTHHECRATVVGTSGAEVAALLRRFDDAAMPWPLCRGRIRPARGKIAFVFSGQGPQWWGMGRDLLAEPVFRSVIHACDAAVARHASWSLVEELGRDESGSRLAETAIAQPAIVAVQVGIAAVLRSWGIEPGAVVGHSVGELAAAAVSGSLPLDEAMRAAVHRGRIMQRAAGGGRMASIGASRQDVRRALAEWSLDLDIAAENAPALTVIAGQPALVEEAVRRFERRDVPCQVLPVDYAFHSRQMTPLAAELRAELGTLTTETPAIPMHSTVTADRIAHGDMTAAYWEQNVARPVRFEATIERLAREGVATFVEIAPHPVLRSAMDDTLASFDERPTVVSTLRRGRPDRAALMCTVGALHTDGVEIDWARLFPADVCVALPAYPWQRERHWLAGWSPAGQVGVRVEHPAGVVAWRRIASPFIQGALFETTLDLHAAQFLGDHVIHGTPLVPGAAFLALLHEAVSTEWKDACLESVAIVQPMPLDAVGRTIQLSTVPDAHGAALRLASRVSGSDLWTTHLTARCSMARRVSDVSAASSAGEQVDTAAFYRALSSAGAAFGPAFQTIRALWCGSNEATADVDHPGVAPAWTAGPHPALLDGCLQTLWAALPSADRGVLVPAGLGSVAFASNIEAPLRAHARVRGIDERGAQGDVIVRDRHDAIVAEMLDIRLRRLPAEALAGSRAASEDALLVPEWHAAPARAARDFNAASGRWLLIADRDGVAEALSGALAERGHAPIVVEPDVDGERVKGDIAKALESSGGAGPLLGIVYLGSLDSPAPADADDARAVLEAHEQCLGRALAVVQALVAAPTPAAPLTFVTRGSQRVGSEHAPVASTQSGVWGLARTLLLEHPELQPTMVDLDPDARATDVHDLLASCAGDDRTPSAWRGGVRHYQRFASRAVFAGDADAAADSRTDGVRLEIAERGGLDGLVLRPSPRVAPGPGEVEVRVEATGLNFRDVLSALGMYPGEPGPLGQECSGRVVRVGAGVTALQPDNAVMALAEGSFSRFVTVPAGRVAHRPEGLDAARAATLPICFLTAQCALETLADVKAGESVLIHAGAGGVGLAAIQIARRRGARVLATAGSDEKRHYLASHGVELVTTSRSVGFVDDVMRFTDGRGVDVVLNSLAGDFIPASLSVVASGGRFIEIGKTGVWDAARVAVERPDIAYHVLYLGEMFERDPATTTAMLQRLAAEVSSGSFQPLPVTAFPLDEAARAFRHMAQAAHIGKIVLTQRAAPRGSSAIRDNGAYLITGGLGSLGLHAAREIARRGAEHVVLMGRHGPSAAAAAAIADLERPGTRVSVAVGDVARAADVERAIAAATGHGTPLAGVIHAAGVLDDGVLMQLSAPRLTTVLTPKVAGAWNLHRATARMPLDFFVLFSSIASVAGSAGQGHYAAANASLDALAAHRHARGLPALSINWGAWAAGGMADALAGADKKRWADRGVRAMDPAVAVKRLVSALAADASQVMIGDFEPGLFAPGTMPPVAGGRKAGLPAPLEGPALPALLEAELPARRRDRLRAFVTECALDAIGLPSTYPLDPHQGLRDVGLDSLMAVELRNRLQQSMGRPLSATLAFDFPTVAALTTHLAEQLEGLIGRAPAAVAATARREDDLGSLSDQEAEALLAQELAALDERNKGA